MEVRSPGSWMLDMGVKRRRYEEAGVAELWLVDSPAKTILVLRRSGARADDFDVTLEVPVGETLSTPLLEGFELVVADLFS